MEEVDQKTSIKTKNKWSCRMNSWIFLMLNFDRANWRCVFQLPVLHCGT